MTEVSNVTNTVLTALDIGSGIDSTKLARDLTNAISIPQQATIQGKIDSSEAAISAYSLVKFQLDTLKGSFEKLNDADELATSKGTSSDSTKLTVLSVLGNVASGTYNFTINQLAENQKVVSDQYTSTSQSLNSGTAFNVSLAVGTTKSAVAAIYNATATALETTTLVVGDGTNTVSIASASYTSIADQVSAIQGGSGYGNLLFTVSVNSDGDGIDFTYKTTGTVASAPTLTGNGSTHTITNSVLGESVLTAVAGVAAEYGVTATAAETTSLIVSDGSTTMTLASATYTSIAQQVTAIQGASGYGNLKFTVAANDANNGFKFTYKTTGAVATAPTLTGSGSSHSVSATTTGVTAINSATTTTINVSTDTPAGIVSAINAADTGVKATLIDTGVGSNSYRVLLSGQTGSNGVFTLTSSPDLGFHDTANNLQIARDSIVKYDGLTVTRSSNSINDLIDGVTFKLTGTTNANISVTISNDKSILKTNIQAMVTTYNDALSLLDNFIAVDSEAELAGALGGDSSIVRFLKEKISSAVFGASSTPSGTVNDLRDLGVGLNRYGVITFDETKYDATILKSYDDVVTMLTAGTNQESIYATSSKGLAQDIVTVIEGFISANGVLISRETSAKSSLTDYEDDLSKLEARMDVVYNRYLTQFGAMEGLMASLGSTRDYLTSQFESLSKAYDD
tara:strand:- start:1037 stop:3085 length:2049 start_codon:yes stop_codon:yes gene_type:complete